MSDHRFQLVKSPRHLAHIELGPYWFEVDQWGRYRSHGWKKPAGDPAPDLSMHEIARQASNRLRPGQVNLPSEALDHFARARYGARGSSVRIALLEFYARRLNEIFFRDDEGRS